MSLLNHHSSIQSTIDVALDVLACLGEFSFTPLVCFLSSQTLSSVFHFTVPYATHLPCQHSSLTSQHADIGQCSHPHFFNISIYFAQIPTCHPKTHMIQLSGTRTQSQIPQMYISSPIGLVAPVGQCPGIPLSLSSHCANSQSLLIDSFLAILQIQSILPSQHTDLHLHLPSSFLPSFSISFFPILSPHVSLSPFQPNILVSMCIYDLRLTSRPSVIKVLIPSLLDYNPAELTCTSTCTFMLTTAWASVGNGKRNRCKIVHVRDSMDKRWCR